MTNEPAAAAAPLFLPIKGVAPPERAYRYRSLTTTTWVFTALAGANVLAVTLRFVALVGQWRLLGQMGTGGFASQDAMNAAASASDARVAAVAIFMLITLVPAYIAGGVWIYNAACNARALGARGLQTSPGWAVGWFFVPFMCLFKPYLAMEEIDRASASPTAWGSQRTPSLLRWWWAAWLVSGISGNAINLLARGMTTLPELSTLTVLQLIECGLDAAAVSLFLAVVWRVYRRQVATRTALGEIAEVFA
jgi:hypothetical protein